MLGPLNPHRFTADVSLSRYPATINPEKKESSMVNISSAQVTGTPFDGFLKYQNYSVEIEQNGSTQSYQGGFVHGPGHHTAAVAAFAFDEEMNPYPILKSGDTRLARSERGESYVKDGFIAGRMDKEGAESSKIALAEIAEEVGGEVLADTFRPLGNKVSPTMPFESTESDAYYLAAVQITGDPAGDGGEMEVADLIGAKILSANEAIEAMDNGEVSEGSRTRTMFGRGFDVIGYLPQLKVYVHDHPDLLKKYTTLGLGAVSDLRNPAIASPFPDHKPVGEKLTAQINDVVSTRRNEISLGSGHFMIDATTRHAVKDNGEVTQVGAEFPNQYLKLSYDRAKVATYYWDPDRGPMIQMSPQVRPILAFAPDSPDVVRLDVQDVQVSRDSNEATKLSGARQLGQASGASAGQSDLYYQFWAKEIEKPNHPEREGYLALSKCIELCRNGQGDAQTEALLERLANDLDWIPNLGMSVNAAKRLKG